jgi:hypothetical protein
LFIGGEFPARRRCMRRGNRGALPGRQGDWRLFVSGELQHETRNFVLRVSGQGAGGRNGAIEQFRHGKRIRFSSWRRKQKPGTISHRTFFAVPPAFSGMRRGAFHVKHFGKIGAKNRTRPNTATPPSFWCDRRHRMSFAAIRKAETAAARLARPLA